MKTLMLALLIPIAVCTACGKKEESIATTAPSPSVETPAPSPSVATPAPATVDAASRAPAAGPAPVSAPAPVHVTLVPASGSSVSGILTVTNEGDAVSILGEINGLKPGTEHGFHVHEVGDCSLPDFMSAGEHFNPTNDPHGGPKSKARHLGDLPNAKADKNGRALIDVTVKGPNLVDKDGAPTEILGKALVVHAMTDDHKTQPSGGSGARIACGVIR
jgi:superoxide dismutase, Cu-Zn family